MTLAFTACGGDDDGDDGEGACGPEVPVEATPFESVGKLAVVSVVERTEGRFASARFLDYSTFDADAAPTVSFDDVCSAVVGRRVVRSEATPLDVQNASLQMGDSDVEFQQVGEGRLQANDLDPFVEGSTVRLEVRGGYGSTEFPSFSTELLLPQNPSGLAVHQENDGTLVVEWTPGDRQAVSIAIREVDAAEGDEAKVRCVVNDDGCLHVSPTAISWLTQTLDPVALDVDATAIGSSTWGGTDTQPEIGYLEVERTTSERFQP